MSDIATRCPEVVPQDDARALGHEALDVVDAGDAALGDLHDIGMDLGGEASEHVWIDLEGLEVATVDADQLGVERLRALGLRRISASVVHEDGPVLQGMLRKVNHLVKVEEVSE